MQYCVILNPRAGRSRGAGLADRLREHLGHGGAEVVVRVTTGPGAAERIAAAAHPGEFDAVFAAGGDGTVNEVINGLAPEIPLGVLPLGTANVLARELGLPVHDPAAACRIALAARPRPIDLGLCNERRFVLMAGIGFDAEAVRDVPPNVKDLIGAPAYVLSGLKALAHLPAAITYELELEDRRLEVRGLMLVAANAASYAGPLRIAPHASIDDGFLDLCLFRQRNRLAFLGQLIRVVFRRQLQDPRFLYLRARELRVTCHPAAAVQLDGDYYTRTPVTIRVLPGALKLLAPAPDAARSA